MTPVQSAVFAMINDNAGICINEIMNEIGYNKEGGYTNNQVFGAVQSLKKSGDIFVDLRTKKNQGLYVKDAEMAAEPLKKSFRSATAKVKSVPAFRIVDASGTVIEQSNNEEMLKAFAKAMKGKGYVVESNLPVEEAAEAAAE